MGIFDFLTGADKFKKAADIQAKTATENRKLAEGYTSQSIADLDKGLTGALGSFDTAASYQSPFNEAGQGALSRLGDIYGLNGAEGTARGLSSFTESPGYQFRLSQGVQALDRGANARSGLYSGAQGKALVDYGQNVASDEWSKYVGGLSGLAGYGQNAANTLSNIATGRANAMLGTGQNKASTRLGGLSTIVDSNAQAGAAQAGGYINQANATNNLLGGLLKVGGFAFGAR